MNGSFSGRNQGPPILTEKSPACRNLVYCSFISKNPRSVLGIVLQKGIPQTFRVPDERIKKTDEVHVASLRVLPCETPHARRGSLRVDNLRPFAKKAVWVSLQVWVEPNNFLVRAKDVSVEQESDRLFADVA